MNVCLLITDSLLIISSVFELKLSSDSHNFVPDAGLHFQTKDDFNLSFLEDFAGSFKRYGPSDHEYREFKSS